MLFISYSHADSGFADRLARQLAYRNVLVWIDRWEMNVGDSIVQKINDAIEDADALLVLLSTNSVESEWCRKELNVGLIRELDERNVTVLPVLVEDCKIPLFLRDKQYADFRTSFDEGFGRLLESVAKYSNRWMRRINTDGNKFFTDWSIEWGPPAGPTNPPYVQITAVDHSVELPHCVLATVYFQLDNRLGRAISGPKDDDGAELRRAGVVEQLCSALRAVGGIDVYIRDSHSVNNTYPLLLDDGSKAVALTSIRRMGDDTGRDIYYHLSRVLQGVVTTLTGAARPAD